MPRLHRLLLLIVLGALAPIAAAQAPPPAGFPGTPPEGPPVTIRSFRAEPSTIGGGPDEYAMLRWEVLNAYSLSIDPDIGTVATRGAERVAPSATTTYTLTATGTGGATTRSVTITVPGTTPRVADGDATAARDTTPIPRLPDGKPDLSGVYAAERSVRLVRDIKPVPGADSYRVEAPPDDLGAGINCLPPGVPAATMMPFPLQIVHTPEVLAIMYEAYHLFRIVPIGREHAEYLPPAYMGHSVARWDGDTLVVAVRGFNDKTVIAGYRHTEDLVVFEHYRRTTYETIEYDAYVSDTNVFAEALHYSGTLTLHPEWEIGEYVCTENDQDYEALFQD
jgi:hypothetical protein